MKAISAAGRIIGLTAALLIITLTSAADAAETLYNGIVLPAEWPPRLESLPRVTPTPPYLVEPPAVIPIDVGRQLFVDDFLIESTTMTRTYHRLVPCPGNPILAPEQPWEKTGNGPMTTPCGVCYDPQDRKFKLWYTCGYGGGTALAYSDDGIRWTRPDLRDGANRVWDRSAHNVILDWNDPDPARRFKTVVLRGSAVGYLEYFCSPDGIHWNGPFWSSGKVGDATSFFYNPFRKKWVISVRESSPNLDRGRIRRYWEVENINDGAAVAWGEDIGRVPLWCGTDWGLDAPRVDLGIPPQLYFLDCDAYESLMLGAFTIFHGYFNTTSGGTGRVIDPDRPKANELCLGFSRDGFHWSRPVHQPMLGLSETRGNWNWGNIRSASPAWLVVGDNLYFYCSARRGKSFPGCNDPDAGGSGGLLILRRDGFASMDAGAAEAALTTRKVSFRGKRLFVNVDAPEGELRVEALDAEGKVIPPFSRANCLPVTANTTLHEVTWQGSDDLATLVGRDVKFRFYLANGRLFAFWVSPDANGASHGYVGAGGPGFTGPTDTVGKGVYVGNRTPWAKADADQAVRDADGNGAETLRLDAAKSMDNDGRIVSFTWYEDGRAVATGATPTVDLTVGKHTLILAVTDDAGATGYDEVVVNVLPRHDPTPPRARMILWLKADGIEGLKDGDAVALWPDSCGNRLDSSQPEEGKRPVWKSNVVSGRPAVRFDGVDDHLKTAYWRNLMFTFHQVTVFVVFRPEGKVENRGLLGEVFNSLSTRIENGGSLAYYGPDWVTLQTTRPNAVRASEWNLGELLRIGPEPGAAQLFVNGARDDNGIPVAYHNINAVTGNIGCEHRGGNSWKGDIAEIIIYADALPDDERQAVERYLGRKYGLSLRSNASAE